MGLSKNWQLKRSLLECPNPCYVNIVAVCWQVRVCREQQAEAHDG